LCCGDATAGRRQRQCVLVVQLGHSSSPLASIQHASEADFDVHGAQRRGDRSMNAAYLHFLAGKGSPMCGDRRHDHPGDDRHAADSVHCQIASTDCSKVFVPFQLLENRSPPLLFQIVMAMVPMLPGSPLSVIVT